VPTVRVNIYGVLCSWVAKWRRFGGTCCLYLDVPWRSG